jgi:hypothetical protein
MDLKNANAAGMSRRARAWLNAYGNSMRREREIICKLAGENFWGGELSRVGWGASFLSYYRTGVTSDWAMTRPESICNGGTISLSSPTIHGSYENYVPIVISVSFRLAVQRPSFRRQPHRQDKLILDTLTPRSTNISQCQTTGIAPQVLPDRRMLFGVVDTVYTTR